MDKPSQHEACKWRLQKQKTVLSRMSEAVAAAKDRVENTRRMIAESKTLLGKARMALESSKVLRETEIVRRVPGATS